MLANSKVVHEDIYGKVENQKAAVIVFSELIDQRNKLLEEAVEWSGVLTQVRNSVV